MLAELLKFYSTPASKYAKKMGYLAEVVATQARHKRLAEQWHPHLENTKKAILEGAKRCKKHDKVVVLGSGHLLDIPLGELSSMFKDVALVDIVHPNHVRKIVEKYSNVTLITADVTNRAEELCKKEPLLSESKPHLFLDIDVDYTISANLLSQLPITPNRWLRKIKVGDAIIYGFCKQLIESHLDYLRALSGNKIVITDMDFIALDMDGEVIAEESAIYDVQMPVAVGSWLWDIAPAPEIERDLNFQHKVGVFYL